MTRSLTLLAALLVACAPARGPEGYDDWFGDMGALDEDVLEPVEFTSTPYDGPSTDRTVASLLPLYADFRRVYAPNDLPANVSCGDWRGDQALPAEIWGIVTVLPRYYFKTVGCESQADAGTSDEKYYGSYFIQDASGGVFVLGDSKVAHFDMGDRVKIRVRGVGRRFGLNMVVAHEVVEVDYGPYPIPYTPAEPLSQALTYPDEAVGAVRRVEGVVLTRPDTFGEFTLQADDGNVYAAALDAELNRRGVGFDAGRRIRATGPVQRAFGDKLVIMRVGQLEPLD